MDKEQVTLLAALIAALASMISLIGDLFSTWRGELRAAHRNALSPFLAGLGYTLDKLLNACMIFNKTVEGGKLDSSGLQDALSTVSQLNEIRSKVKYPLWGIDLGLDTLLQVPSWLRDWTGDPRVQERLIRDANNLKQLLDEVIRQSYHDGRPPTKLQIWRLRSRSNQLKQNWGTPDQ